MGRGLRIDGVLEMNGDGSDEGIAEVQVEGYSDNRIKLVDNSRNVRGSIVAGTDIALPVYGAFFITNYSFQFTEYEE